MRWDAVNGKRGTKLREVSCSEKNEKINNIVFIVHFILPQRPQKLNEEKKQHEVLTIKVKLYFRNVTVQIKEKISFSFSSDQWSDNT